MASTPQYPNPGPGYSWDGSNWVYTGYNQPSGSTATSPTDTSAYNPMTATPTQQQIQQAAAPVLAGQLPLSATGLSTDQLIMARDTPYPTSGDQATTQTGTTAPSGWADPTSAWNTGGYAAPTFSATNYGDAPSGYDPTKWADPNYQDPKYAAGRIYQQDQMAGMTPDQIAQDLIKAYPGSTYNGGDIINIPGIGPVDFVVDYGGANKVAWQPLDSMTSSIPSGSDIMSALNGGMTAGYGGSGGGATMPIGSGGGGSTAPNGSSYADLQAIIDGFGGGGLNEDALNARLNSARDTLDATRTSQMSTLLGELADRGIVTDGPLATDLGKLNEQLGAQYGQNVENIFGDESDQADQRMMTALGLLSGQDVNAAQLASAERQNSERVQAQLQQAAMEHGLGEDQLGVTRELGLGNLALGQGQLGLNADTQAFNEQNSNWDLVMRALQILYGGSNTTAQGTI